MKSAQHTHDDHQPPPKGVGFTDPLSGDFKVDLEYRYDAIGRRTQKRDGNTTHHYLYDRFDLIAIHTFYPDGTESTATLVHDETIDTPLSIKNRHGTFYYHRDHQGSMLALTDEDGKTVESFEDDNSYGVIIKHTTTEGMDTQNPFGYTGREVDRQDLYYYRARYYDPVTGQFISEDPAGFLSNDFNFYRYVTDSPISHNDPIGCAATAVLGAELGAGAGTTVLPGIGTVVGGIIGGLIGLGVGWLGWKAVESIADNSATTHTDGASVTGSKDVDCGDKGRFKDQRRPYRDPENKLERDHIPSKALVHDYAKRMLVGDGLESIVDCVKKEITKNMDTLALPIDIHKEKTRRTRPNSMSDAERLNKSDNLPDTAREEADVIEEEVDDAMDDDDPCKGKIKEKLEEFRNLSQEYFDNLIEKAIDFCS